MWQAGYGLLFRRRWTRTGLGEGSIGDGVVVRAWRYDLGKMVGPGFRQTYKLRRRIVVRFSDGEREFAVNLTPRRVSRFAGERTGECWSALAGRTAVGKTVPIRYDPRDHSRVVLDLQALVEQLLADEG